MDKTICFDVIGTMFGYDKVIQAISAECPSLPQPELFFLTWFWSTQRDFAYLSMTKAYTPIAQILKHTFIRTIQSARLECQVDDASIGRILKAFQNLGARPGLQEGLARLDQAGFTFWAATNGAKETTAGYFGAAGISTYLPLSNIISCDELQLAKTDPGVYARARQSIEAANGEAGSSKPSWFVASHMWDLKAAKIAGYKTAYLSFEEGSDDGLWAIFGRPDIVAKDYPDLVDQLLASS